jgi:hypothetical protein
MTGDELRRLLTLAGGVLLEDRNARGNRLPSDAVAASITQFVENQRRRSFDTETAIRIVKDELSGGNGTRDQIAMGIVAALEREMAFLARVSAGYSADRRCEPCGGPIEEGRTETFCEKCALKARNLELLDRVDWHAAELDRIRELLAHAEQRRRSSGTGRRGRPSYGRAAVMPDELQMEERPRGGMGGGLVDEAGPARRDDVPF